MTESIADVPVLECQRWRNGRSSYRPAGELFDPSYAEVQPIDDKTARRFVEKNHYSGSFPAARFCAGIFVKNRFMRDELMGVGVFSVSMTNQVIPAYFKGLEPSEGVELGRFVLDESLASNAESWALARMKRALLHELPGIRGILAYSDPVERRDIHGRLTKRGHVGTIYKATNAAFRGRSSARTLWLAPNGESLADRMLGKIRLGEQGERYAMAKLEKLGAPARGLRESGVDYITRLKTDAWLRPLRHPGNLAYTWELGDRAPERRGQARPANHTLQRRTAWV